MSDANQVDLRYILESVWGTTPATPALSVVRMTGESLSANVQTEVSNEILATRNVSDVIQVGAEAGGGAEFELSYASFNDWIEAMLCGTWAVVTGDQFAIVNASVERSFTIQKRHADISQYFIFTGARVGTMSLAIAPGKIVTGSFGVSAKQGVRASSGIAGATYPAGQTTTPMNGAAGVILNQVDAAVIPGGLMNFTLDMTNNLRVNKAVGSLAASAIRYGRFEATGDFETYFADGTLYDKFINQTAFALQIKMEGLPTGGPNQIWIDIPNAKYKSSEVMAEGVNTDVMLKTTYQALYHAATTGSVKITRDGPT